MSQLYHSLAVGSGAFEALALTRVITSRLWSKEPYRGFAVMLSISLARELYLLTIPADSDFYGLAWIRTLPFALAGQVYAAFVASRAIVHLYRGIGKFATWLFIFSLLITAIVGCIGLPFELLQVGTGYWGLIRRSLLLARWTDTLIAGGMILSVAFLAHLPRPMRRMPRNLVTHVILFTAYFTANSLIFFLGNLFKRGPAVVAVDAVFFVFISLLYLGWFFGLSKKGEESQEWPGLPPQVADYIENKDRRLLQLYRDFASDAWHQATGRK